MAKRGASRYVCSHCGAVALQPLGRCPRCSAWGAMEEEQQRPSAAPHPGRLLKPEAIGQIQPPQRLPSGFDELDRVLGGGWVPGGVVLLGGQPGIGKSTLLLQVCGRLAQGGHRVLYLSGEESPSQLGLRGQRLGVVHQGLEICCHSEIDPLLELIDGHSLVVVDSVQAMKTQSETGWAGTPSQVRAVAQLCLDRAKELAVPMVLVGHITKEGRIAGPMLLEHMVDAVVMFAGESSSLYRTLRASKNRYGGTEELGIFEMTRQGLLEVADPSCLYWNRQDSTVPGVAMTVVMEGSRPLMAEIQALASPTPLAYPKRAGLGVGVNKLHLLLAVLQSRCGLASLDRDLYCNVAGGLEIRDPAADLALAAALASALTQRPIGPDCCLLGEIGLAGELRPVAAASQRLREAHRLGFRRALVSAREKLSEELPLKVYRTATLAEALARLSILG